MRIQHNSLSKRTTNILSNNQSAIKKDLEKLSSGYRINRAADDAAGLSISEEMRSRINGLTQGDQNIQDGIGLIETADGALTEIHSMLQRMNVLATQSANGTYNQDARSDLQKEVQELQTEIDRIANETNVNDIYPLRGVEAVEQKKYEIPLIEIEYYSAYNGDEAQIEYNGRIYQKNEVFLDKAIYDAETDTYAVTWYRLNIGWDMADQEGRLSEVTSTMETNSPSNPLYESGKSDKSISVKLEDLQVDEDGYVFFETKETHQRQYYYRETDDYDPTLKYITGVMGASGEKVKANLQTFNIADSEKRIWIQASAEQKDGLYIDPVDASAKGIGIDQVNVSTLQDANEAIGSVKKAIDKVSQYRAKFGAVQNRLEHTLNSNRITNENISAAESRIRDTDMAVEIAKYTKDNILSQVSESMLTQANQKPQSVLDLLK